VVGAVAGRRPRGCVGRAKVEPAGLEVLGVLQWGGRRRGRGRRWGRDCRGAGGRAGALEARLWRGVEVGAALVGALIVERAGWLRRRWWRRRRGSRWRVRAGALQARLRRGVEVGAALTDALSVGCVGWLGRRRRRGRGRLPRWWLGWFGSRQWGLLRWGTLLLRRR
jgi:hypothetical protein